MSAPGSLSTIEALSGGLTHPGLVREENEDAILKDDRRQIWAVADGMGGHDNGAFASSCVIEFLTAVRTFWSNPKSLTNDLVHRLEDANEHIRSSVADGGGSTVACVAKYADLALVVWAGDSRVYHWRAAEGLRQVTTDHSFVQQLIDAGELDPSDAESHPMASVITAAVGGEDVLPLDFETVALESGDRLMICSDGLSRVVPGEDIADMLMAQTHPQSVSQSLLQAALNAGGPDNVSVVVVEMR